MATRVERRSLRERTRALMEGITRLWNRHGDEDTSSVIHRANATRFHSLLKQTRSLARIARGLNPRDRAWEYYDKEVLKIDEQLQRRNLVDVREGSRMRVVREGEKVFSSHVLGWLRQALQMVEGSLERTRHPNLSQLQDLSSRMFYGLHEERRAAREVLADALEQMGLLGEANAIRRDRWADDKRVLQELGVRHPRSRPYPAPKLRRDPRAVDVKRVHHRRSQKARRR